jgi:lipid-A-disaccharide synthase
LEVVGFGGERMAAEGCRLLYPLTDLAVVGVGAILANLHRFSHVLGLARRSFREQRPDALVMIDYPGFHWWLAGCARKHGVPVSYFVPPQIWGWATWRVRKMRRLCDQVLAALPFEEPWLKARGVRAQYIGHPYFDELHNQRLDGDFLAAQRARPGTVVALLPGSRASELRRNAPTLLRAAGLIHAKRPDARFLVACLKEAQAAQVRELSAGLGLPVEVHHGRTAEIIHLAHSCLSVSGSVSLELLFRGKPSVMLYTVAAWGMAAKWLLQRCRYITLVNLLADRLLFPEYVTTGCAARQLAGHVLHWMRDREAYESLVGELAKLRREVAAPGACERAAAAVLELAGRGQRRAA